MGRRNRKNKSQRARRRAIGKYPKVRALTRGEVPGRETSVQRVETLWLPMDLHFVTDVSKTCNNPVRIFNGPKGLKKGDRIQYAICRMFDNQPMHPQTLATMFELEENKDDPEFVCDDLNRWLIIETAKAVWKVGKRRLPVGVREMTMVRTHLQKKGIPAHIVMIVPYGTEDDSDTNEARGI